MKKILLTLGSAVAVIAPLATVVACSTKDYSYSPSDVKILAELEKTTTKQKLENEWIGMVIKKIKAYNGKFDFKDWGKNDGQFKKDFASSVKFIIASKLQENDAFLVNLLSTIVKNDKTIKPNQSGSNAYMAVMNVWNSPITTIGKINNLIQNLTEDEIGKIFFTIQEKATTKETIFDPISLGIKSEVLKNLISRAYLQISKKDYRETFNSEYLTNPKAAKELTTDITVNYPLIKNAINAKIGYEWKYNLSLASSAQFILPTGPKDKYADLVSKVSSIEGALKWSEQKHTMPEILNNLQETKAGYVGIKPIAGGVGTLSTNVDKMKKQKVARVGWLSDSKIITEFKEVDGVGKTPNDNEIEYIKSNKLSLTWVHMILPTYDSTKTELKFDKTTTSDINLETALNAIINNNEKTIFDEALKYYTTKKDPIKLEIHNKKIRDILVEKGYDFIKSDK